MAERFDKIQATRAHDCHAAVFVILLSQSADDWSLPRGISRTSSSMHARHGNKTQVRLRLTRWLLFVRRRVCELTCVRRSLTYALLFVSRSLPHRDLRALE